MNIGEGVIVAGAGPVGLWLAAELALADVPVLVMEKEERRGPHSKALGLHPRTLEVLAMRGLEKWFLSEGVPIDRWHFGMLEHRLDFSTLATPFPYMLALPQRRTEELLERRATELGVPIMRGHEVTGLRQNAESVTVEISGMGPREAAYVVGCDGAGSTVRKAAGIGFPGTSHTAYGFIGEVVLDDPPRGTTGAHTAEGVVMVVPLGGGRYRVTGYDPARQGPGDALTLEALRDVTLRVLGTDHGMRDPSWLTRFGNATRHAETYRSGRVLLAGDAAHMHWPAGGVGLNVGVQDAMNLGWRLAAAFHGRTSLLDGYHAERHPVGAELARHTMAQGALITATTPDGQALRALLSDIIATDAPLERKLAGLLTALDVAYPSRDPEAHPLDGSRAPLDLDTYPLLYEGRPVLLDPTGRLTRTGVATSSAGAWDRPGVAALIRPDGHVWRAVDTSKPGADVVMRAALKRLTG
jgi:2-polyprenyl-6-methoxyphenol hydroxylase-like FAD-dependent oxidoreductase